MKIINQYDQLNISLILPEKITLWYAIKLRISSAKKIQQTVREVFEQTIKYENRLIEKRVAEIKGQIH